MIIECTSCGAQYDVGDEVVSDRGRNVQCSVCFKSWTAMPTVPPSAASLAAVSPAAFAPPPVASPSVAPVAREPQPVEAPPSQFPPAQLSQTQAPDLAQNFDRPEMGAVADLPQPEAPLDESSFEISTLNTEALDSLELPDTDILQASDLDAELGDVLLDEGLQSEDVASNTGVETFDDSSLELDADLSDADLMDESFESETSDLNVSLDLDMTTEGMETPFAADQEQSTFQDTLQDDENEGSLDLSELASFLGEEALDEKDDILPMDGAFDATESPDDLGMPNDLDMPSELGIPNDFDMEETAPVFLEEAPLAPSHGPAPEQTETRTKTDKRQSRKLLGVFLIFGSFRGWLGLVFLVSAIGGGGYMWRNEAVNAFPPIKLFYERFDIATEFKQGSLEIVEGQVKFYRTSTLAGDNLTVAGVVRNRSKSTPERTRVIRIDLLDEYGRVLQSELASPVQSLLLPEEESLFQTRISNPAENTVDAALTLTLDYTSLDK